MCLPCSDQLTAAFVFRLKCIRSHDAMFAICCSEDAKFAMPLDSNESNEKACQTDAVANLFVDGKVEPQHEPTECVSVKMEQQWRSDDQPSDTEEDDADADADVVEFEPFDTADPDFAFEDQQLDDDDDDDDDAKRVDDDSEHDMPTSPDMQPDEAPPRRGRGRPRTKHLNSVPKALLKTKTKSGKTDAVAASDMSSAEPAQHACPDCNKTFRRRLHMTRHRLIHSDEKPFGCDQCDKRFRRQDHLNIHRHHHSTVKPFNCDRCGRGFTRPQHLLKHIQNLHLKTENDSKNVAGGSVASGDGGVVPVAAADATVVGPPFICADCHRHFGTLKSLAIHRRRLHDRQFVCKWCGVRCADRDALTEHLGMCEYLILIIYHYTVMIDSSTCDFDRFQLTNMRMPATKINRSCAPNAACALCATTIWSSICDVTRVKSPTSVAIAEKAFREQRI